MYQTPQNKQVSIIIPSWLTNSQHGKYGELETYWFAVECLHKLIERTPRKQYELIIIDNGSTLQENDITDSIVRGDYVGMKNYVQRSEAITSRLFDPEWYWGQADVLIRNKFNLGFAPACNEGFAIARGEYIVCINNDVLVWPGWLEALITPLNFTHLIPPIGVIMPALMKETRDAREALKIEHIDLSQNRYIYGVGAEFGSCWAIKKTLLELLKNKDGYYFDENFRLGFGEDRDLWRRVRKLGFETYRTHETRIFHQGGMSMGKSKNRKSYTLPNRAYFKELLKIEVGDKKLTKEEKNVLKLEIQQSYENGILKET